MVVHSVINSIEPPVSADMSHIATSLEKLIFKMNIHIEGTFKFLKNAGVMPSKHTITKVRKTNS